MIARSIRKIWLFAQQTAIVCSRIIGIFWLHSFTCIGKLGLTNKDKEKGSLWIRPIAPVVYVEVKNFPVGRISGGSCKSLKKTLFFYFNWSDIDELLMSARSK